jgi:hypothetical protein
MGRSSHIRDINRKEKALAKQVFIDTLPYEAIRVTNKLGLQNREYTLVYQAVPELDWRCEERASQHSSATLGGEGEDTYHLNVGPEGFNGMERSQYGRETLIHELTHVWQSCHSIWPASYIFNSAWHQLKAKVTGKDAYKYPPGDPWDSYNVEQQAHIVQDWFAQGQSTDSKLYKYIRNTIRSPKR